MPTSRSRLRFFFLSPPGEPPRPLWVLALNAALAIALLGTVFVLSFAHLDYTWRWGRIYEYRASLLSAWLVTLEVATASMVVSTLWGLALALARRSPLLVLRFLARGVVELIRGTPLLVQILIFYYVVAYAAGLENRYVAGTLALSLFSGAYLSEIFRAGIENIAGSQLDSARAVGFTRWQTYRYVIGLQALRQVLPPLAGQFASLIKDSSLLSIIALHEFTQAAQEIGHVTYTSFEIYPPLATGYLLLTLPISLLARWLEQRHRYET